MTRFGRASKSNGVTPAQAGVHGPARASRVFTQTLSAPPNRRLAQGAYPSRARPGQPSVQSEADFIARGDRLLKQRLGSVGTSGASQLGEHVRIPVTGDRLCGNVGDRIDRAMAARWCSSARVQLPAQAAAIPAAVLAGNPKMLQSHSAAIFSASACKRPASSRRPLRQSASVMLRTGTLHERRLTKPMVKIG